MPEETTQQKSETAESWQQRTQLLLGGESVKKLNNSRVLVMGVGGVGGFAAEFLARAGVGSLILVDADTVEHSNRNRQVQATSKTVGSPKVEILAERLQEIYPEIRIDKLNMYYEVGSGNELFESFADRGKPDAAIDAIDSLSPKIDFIASCLSRSIPLVSALGAGGKLDPARVKTAGIWETYGDLLGQHVRTRLRKLGITASFPAVFSDEPVDKSRIEPVREKGKASRIGTISYMPAVFAAHAVHTVVQILLDQPENQLNNVQL